MKGKYNIHLTNGKYKYDFDIERKVTIIRGESGTGKTTFIRLLTDYDNYGEDSGVELKCKVPCIPMMKDWVGCMRANENSIIFIDENHKFIYTEDFARELKKSNNYFVLISRKDFGNLSYSTESIYRFVVNKNEKILCNNIELIPNTTASILKKDIVVEDASSGYSFYEYLADMYGNKCYTADNNSNIAGYIRNENLHNICVIADGEGFGSQFNRFIALTEKQLHVDLFLPRSFEYILLMSNLFSKDKTLKDKLIHTYDYADTMKYKNWEVYYNKLLTDVSNRPNTYTFNDNDDKEGRYLAYNKSSDIDSYKKGKVFNSIIRYLQSLDQVDVNKYVLSGMHLDID